VGRRSGITPRCSFPAPELPVLERRPPMMRLPSGKPTRLWTRRS